MVVESTRALLAGVVLCLVGCGSASEPPTAVSEVPRVERDAPAPSVASERARITPAQRQRADELLPKLAQAGKEERSTILRAMRDEVGGVGLVMALEALAKGPEERRWFEVKQVMDMIRELGDPDAVDALASWAASPDRHPHWKGEAGAALAMGSSEKGPRRPGRPAGRSRDVGVRR